MDNRYKNLLTPFNIGKCTIKNRFVMGPMGIGDLSTGGACNDEGVAYFAERAKGGVGLIITGVILADNKIDKPMGPVPEDNPALFLKQSAKLVKQCSAYGTKVFAEIGAGVGRNYPTFLAPSAVDCFGYPMMKGVEMSVEQIKGKEEKMIQLAVMAKKAGFAGVDIHTLHWGYLLDEFALSITNKRTDEYGGSLDNRLRFIREILEGIKAACGKDFPVTVGLGVKSYIKALNKASLMGEEEAGRTLEEAIEIAKKLEEMGFDAIMCDTGIYDSFYYACPPGYMDKGHALAFYKQVKDVVNIPVMARSRLGEAELIADSFEKGEADAYVLARPLLADPYFVRKIERGEPQRIKPCIGCNIGCLGAILERGVKATCAVNPRTCNETIVPPRKAIKPRNIAIVGGGVAGMQAALTAVEQGHKAAIYEIRDVLGGELIAAGEHDFKVDVKRLNEWYKNEIKYANIPVYFNTELKPEMVIEKGYDTVILANGASSVMPKSITGIEKAISGVELLEKNPSLGKNIVVVGGGLVGCETAVDLAKKGHDVTIVEALDKVLSSEFIPMPNKMMMADMLEYYKVNIEAGQKLVEVTDSGVKTESKEINADNVIICIGMKPNQSLYQQYLGTGAEIYSIGSINKPGQILNAVHDAFEVVYHFD